MIRLANASDIESVSEIFRQLHDKHISLKERFYKEIDISEFSRIVKSDIENDCDIFVCDEDGEIKGYAMLKILLRDSMFHYTSKYLYIEQFAVSDKVLRQKIGTKLMEFVIEYAGKNNCRFIELDVWDANVEAVEFYKYAGFIPRKHYLELDLNNLNTMEEN